jgi:hypothetical protein
MRFAVGAVVENNCVMKTQSAPKKSHDHFRMFFRLAFSLTNRNFCARGDSHGAQNHSWAFSCLLVFLGLGVTLALLKIIYFILLHCYPSPHISPK